MIIAFFITGTHLSLDYGLIYGHFGLPRLGLNGAAIAAWVGQLVGAVTCLGIFFLSGSTAAYRAVKWRMSFTRIATAISHWQRSRHPHRRAARFFSFRDKLRGAYGS